MKKNKESILNEGYICSVVYRTHFRWHTMRPRQTLLIAPNSVILSPFTACCPVLHRHTRTSHSTMHPLLFAILFSYLLPLRFHRGLGSLCSILFFVSFPFQHFLSLHFLFHPLIPSLSRSTFFSAPLPPLGFSKVCDETCPRAKWLQVGTIA